MNRSGFGILIAFFINVALSRIACVFFATTFDSRLLISITFRCASTIACTFMDWCISTYTFVDSCIFASMTFSSLASFRVVCSSTKCCSIALSSSDSSMNTRSTNVAPGLVYTLARQLLLLLCKNSTIDVLVLYILWIIVCMNCIFSLYAFRSAHSEDDDEFDDDLITNNWIFNTPSCFTFINSFSAFVPLNNFASSSYLCLCSLFYALFSFLFFVVFQLQFLHSCCCKL